MSSRIDISDGTLAGRTILVTGASSGVGRHLAMALASRGAAVVCCARRRAHLDELVAEIAAAGGAAMAAECDMLDAESIARAFQNGESRFGVIDSVICNAGINHAGPALDLPDGELDAVLSVNLRGAFLTAREGARRMIAGNAELRHRRVVFIASIMGLRTMKGAAIYGATKAGVIHLARGLALEWARARISVNTICPGFMPTEIVGGFFDTDAGHAETRRWPRRMPMPVDDLVPAVTFLLAPAAAATTGATIVVDEGQSLA